MPKKYKDMKPLIMSENPLIGTLPVQIFRSRNSKVKSDFSWLVRDLFLASRELRIDGHRQGIQGPGYLGPYL